MNIPKEFRPLVEPPYRAAKMGEWQIVKKPYSKSIRKHKRCTGYWSHSSIVSSRYAWTLMKGERVWMSSTPMELESQGYHARFAYGDVVVAGLGMGALVYNLLKNPKVKHVTVVEQDMRVIELLRLSADWLRVSDRLHIECMNALEFVPAFEYDVLLADIWPTLGAEQAIPDVGLMQKNIDAKIVGWWGQEIDIVSHLKDKGYAPPVTDSHIQQFEDHFGAKLIGASHPEYKKLVFAAVATLSRSVVSKTGTIDEQIMLEHAIKQVDAMNAIGGPL